MEKERKSEKEGTNIKKKTNRYTSKNSTNKKTI